MMMKKDKIRTYNSNNNYLNGKCMIEYCNYEANRKVFSVFIDLEEADNIQIDKSRFFEIYFNNQWIPVTIEKQVCFPSQDRKIGYHKLILSQRPPVDIFESFFS